MKNERKRTAHAMRRPFFSIQPEAILWDVDDTLLDFTRCSQQALARACTRFSLPFDQTMYQTYRAVDDALWQAQRAGQCTVAFVMQTRFAHWFARLGIAADDRAFSQAYAQELACTHIREPYALETLAQLSKHIPLYAASNGIHAMQMQRLQRAGLLPFLSDVFVSDVLGYEKPDVRFFHACLHRMGKTANPAIWMIGDSLTADVEGAKRSGLSACWYARHAVPDAGGYAGTVVLDLRACID